MKAQEKCLLIEMPIYRLSKSIKMMAFTLVGFCLLLGVSFLSAHATYAVQKVEGDNLMPWIRLQEAKIERHGLQKSDLEEAIKRLGAYKEGPQFVYLTYLKGLDQISAGHVNVGYKLMNQALEGLSSYPNNKLEIIILSRQLNVATYFQQSNDIIEKGFRLHDLAEVSKDYQNIVDANVALIGAYISLGDQEKVAELLGEIDHKISVKASDLDLQAVYMMKGDLAMLEAQNDKALSYYKAAYEDSLKHKRYLSVMPLEALIKTRMVDANTRLGHIQEAETLIEEVALSANKSRPVEMANLYYHKALISNAAKRIKEAIGYFEKVRMISKEIENLEGAKSDDYAVVFILADLYYQTGDYKKSAEAYQEYERVLASQQTMNQLSKAISDFRTHEEQDLKEKVRFTEELRINQEKLLKAQNDKLIVFRVLAGALGLIILLIVLNVVGLRKRQKQLIRLSSTDYLTQVENRDAIMKAIQAAASADNILILMDVDNFKTINDQHGHLVGDEVLVRIAQTIKASLREKDHVARYGGEEFLVFLENTNVVTGMEIAERIRASVASIPWPNNAIVTTLSIGLVATFSKDVDVVLKEADVLMYKAKQSGKNRICIQND